MEEELVKQEWEEHVEQLDELLHWLDRADIDPSLTNVLEEDSITQVVIRWLLNMIDNLQDKLEKAKQAQQDVETYLIWATHKHPMSPCQNDVDDTSHQQKCKCSIDNSGVLTT